MMAPNKQQVYQTGIQDKGPIDVTAELTYIAGQKEGNFKKDETPGTFGDIVAVDEVVLETEWKMFSQNEERIKHELEETPPTAEASNEKVQALDKLEQIIAKESTNLQWWKISVNLGMLLIMLVCMILRGPGSEPSVIGIKPCDGPDFVLLGLMLAAAGTITYIAISFTREEYAEKVEVGYNFVKGDQTFQTLEIIRLILIALVGAFLAATCGISTGAIFFPVLIQLDMHSAVASSTAMYLTMFTTLTATINALIIESVNVQYMLVLCALTIVFSIPGIICQPMIREKAGGRT